MKKILVLLPGVLLVVFVIFSAIDRSDYSVEKKIWKVQRQLGILAQEGKSAPADQLEDLAKKDQDMIRKYPQSDLLSQMYMQLAQIYVFTKDFDKARTNYGLVLERFPQQQVICAKALIAIGSTYLAQNRGDDAITFYKVFVREHPDSPLDGGLRNAITYLQGVKAKQKLAE